eukprot:SAG31_NODE_4218_length_3453_cov_2.228682_2_plen_130_part_00
MILNYINSFQTKFKFIKVWLGDARVCTHTHTHSRRRGKARARVDLARAPQRGAEAHGMGSAKSFGRARACRPGDGAPRMSCAGLFGAPNAKKAPTDLDLLTFWVTRAQRFEVFVVPHAVPVFVIYIQFT